MAFEQLAGVNSLVDQRAYGVCLLDADGIPRHIRKRTQLRVTDLELAETLSRRCDGSHTHLRLEGRNSHEGNLIRAAASYPTVLCQ